MARTRGLLQRQVDHDTLLYDTTNNQVHSLNRTATAVWECCDGAHSIADIAERLTARDGHVVSGGTVALAVEQLRQAGLLANGASISTPLSGMSRREALRKIGIASVVAAPMVLSMAAPAAAQAISGGPAPVGGVCSLGTPSTCSTSNCLNSAGMGVCCAGNATQANSPGYTICVSDPSAAVFATRCCSGSASVASVQACPTAGHTRYTCNPY
jgi:hypothetical protein